MSDDLLMKLIEKRSFLCVVLVRPSQILDLLNVFYILPCLLSFPFLCFNGKFYSSSMLSVRSSLGEYFVTRSRVLVEIDHAITIDVHLRVQRSDETWRHGLVRCLLHAFNCLIRCDLILAAINRFIPLFAPNLQLFIRTNIFIKIR